MHSRSREFFCRVIALCVLFWPCVASAFSELPVKFQRLMLADGLSQSSILAVYQDSRGFIWMGTQDGLNRYDGRRIISFKADPDNPNSLSSSTVWCITEDPEGDLWVGTEGGGFDCFHRETETFTQYRYDPWASTPGRFYDVRAIAADSSGNIWIGTHGDGLLCFDKRTGVLTPYRNDPIQPGGLPDDHVSSVMFDSATGVWVGTDKGLTLFDPATGKMRNWLTNMPDGQPGESGLPAGEVQALSIGRGGGIWVGSATGLAHIDQGSFRVDYRPAANAAGRPSSLSVVALQEMPGGELWIGSAHQGVFKLNLKSGAWRGFRNDPQDPTSLSDDEVYVIREDHTGVVWIGTSNGANRLDSRAKQFYHFFNKPGDPLSLSNDCVWSMCEDKRGNLWVVTESGINILDFERNTMTQVFADPDDPLKPSYDSFIQAREDSQGGIWLGARDGALNRYDPETGIYRRFEPDPDDPRSVGDDRVFSIVCDQQGRVWIGTMSDLECYDPDTGLFTRFQHDPEDPDSIPSGSVRALHGDGRNRIWMSLWGSGVCCLDVATGSFRHFVHDDSDRNSLVSNVVLSITSDPQGRIWVGTSSGLDLLDPVTGSCRRYSMKDGLPNNTIYRIESDNARNLWVATNFGLARFNPVTGEVQSFVDRDGIQNNEFNMGASHVGRSGRMYFGGIRGFNAFYPDHIRSNPIAPQVVLTDFRIFNKPVPIGPLPDGRTVLERAVSETDHIELTHKDHVISFEFADLHFASPLKNNYAYILEGFEDRWNEVGTRNHATYTNLPPGDYTFRIKGSNNDGIWNNHGRAVTLHVKPPFYRTAWFIGGMVLFVVVTVYGAHRYRMRLLDVKNKLLEQRVNERTSDLTFANQALQQEINVRKQIEEELREARNKAVAATKAKSEFLANMSHEIRTPMNGVLGMTAILLDTDLSRKQKEYADAVHTSATNLLAIINDILDFSKVEAGKLNLEEIEFDLVSVLDRVTETLGCKAQTKGLSFSSELDEHVPRYLVGDPGRLTQVLVNLANNAVKFTHRGDVQVKVSCPQIRDGRADLHFEVRDTGVGIPPDRLDQVFESFTQVDTSITRKFGGTGLGLAIVKQLTSLMGGEVQVESAEGRGTTFHVHVSLEMSQPKIAHVQPERILVVHSQPKAQETMRRILAGLGYHARTVAPETALGVFAKSAAEDRPFQIVFLDDAATGEGDLPRQMRNIAGDQTTRIFMLCPHGWELDEAGLEGMGLSGWLTVPPLYDRLEELLAGLHSPAAGVPSVETLGIGCGEDDESATAQRPLILLAEDNAINQRVAILLLEKLGYRVDVVENGVEALAAVAEKDYAAVLLDVQMPEMAGLEAARRIRADDSPARNPQVPLIALTAHARTQDRQRSLESGMDDHLAKPINSASLGRTLAKYIARSKPKAPQEV